MATPTTLPATFVSGAVLTAAQQNDLRGAFRVLQVVTEQTTIETTSNSSTFIATTLTATITPSSTSSKILIIVSHSTCYKSPADPNNRLNMRLYKNGVFFSQITTNIGFMGSSIDSFFAVVAQRLDSPNTVSAVTYATFFMNSNNAADVRVQRGSDPSTITLMEISACPTTNYATG